MTDKTRSMTITFTNGKKQRFEFMSSSEDPNVVARKMEKMLASGHLIVHVEDRVHFYPLANIESVEVSPAPVKTAGFIMQAIRELD
jgi:hypothetical protein